MRRIMIIGASGQDGRLLAELHKDRDEIMFVCRDKIYFNFSRKRFEFGLSKENLDRVLSAVSNYSPRVVYYLAAIHGSSTSTVNSDENHSEARRFLDQEALHCLFQLKCLRDGDSVFFYAGSSKVYGGITGPVGIGTPFNPVCGYSISKVGAIESLDRLRAQTSTRIITAILFHHHSEFRNGGYALERIVSAIAVGNHDAGDYINDWAAAEDFSAARATMRVAFSLAINGYSGRAIIGCGVPRTLDEIRAALIQGNNLTPYSPFREALQTIWADPLECMERSTLVADELLPALRAMVLERKANGQQNVAH